MKVSELAAELKRQNKEIIDKAAELGIDARGATKKLTEAETDKIRSGFSESAHIAAAEKKARMMPRRIAKADVEEAERAKAEAEAAEEAKRLLEEEAVKAAAKATPQLKVAKKAVEEPEPKPLPKKAEADEGAKAKPAAGDRGKPVHEKPTSKVAEKADDKPKTAPKEPPVLKVARKDEQKKPDAVAKDGSAERARPQRDGDRPKGAGKPEEKGDMRQKPTKGAEQGPKVGDKDAAKDAKGGEKKDLGRDKDKKGGKGKETKPDDASKKKAKGTKKGGRGDDFRGSAKNPILDDGSLEKEKRKKYRGGAKPGIDEVEEPVIVPEGTFVVNVPITVAGLAEQIERSTSEIILALLKMGIISNINQNLDEEMVQLVAIDLGASVAIGYDEGELVEEGIEDFEDDPADLVPRPPIITVMGHVDHGKTSLLDAIRKTNTSDKEAGGITQHIGAYEVFAPSGERVVFLDTPGHEAFTAMRARGAHVTDIAVLVVAADDGVMPQTIESISHAKAADVPIIVAINKIDKPGANLDRVKQELSENGVLVEDWGGEVISVPVSAKTGEGLENLLEMALLQAEVLELRANPGRHAMGTVIEARLDKNKGPLATVLVLNGTLTDKMSILAGTTSAKVRTLTDFKGKPIKSAGPATAVEITGFAEVPHTGDEFHALDDDKVARDIAEKRRTRQREQVLAKTRGTSFDTLFSQIKEGEMKELKVIIKADVQGSVGALSGLLDKIDVEGVRINMIHRGVGTVTESDVMLASTSGAVIIGFNVRPNSNVTALAEREGVEIRLYRIIYDVIGELEAALKGLLDPEYREVVLGKAEVRETFRLPNGNQIAGSYVLNGKIGRNSEVRLVRDGVVVHEGKVGSLRRFKDDVREVDHGYECGIGIENYNDIKIGDEIEAFMMEEIERE
ncbi:MAG: translation initiation factor IF-2 [Clostridiales bacterium]|nr:translation initiation factor IF-2 [Clostridiales bacterium]